MKPRDPNPMNLSSLILAVLSVESMHGYAISRKIREQSEDAFQFGEGTLYPALKSLLESGLVEAVWVTEEPGPAKKVYSITGNGQDELRRRRVAWRDYSRRIGLLLKEVPDGTI